MVDLEFRYEYFIKKLNYKNSIIISNFNKFIKSWTKINLKIEFRPALKIVFFEFEDKKGFS